MNENDNILWSKVKKADKVAFEALYKRYYNSLCLYAYSIVPHKEIVKEIVNDVFLRIWEKAGEIDIKKEIKPYLYKCIHNACLDYIDSKSSNQLKKNVIISERTKELTGPGEDNIMDFLFFVEVEKDVMKSIDQLPTQSREIFLLSRFELLSHQEISEKLNISINTVKTQISRALNTLRNSLKKYL